MTLRKAPKEIAIATTACCSVASSLPATAWTVAGTIATTPPLKIIAPVVSTLLRVIGLRSASRLGGNSTKQIENPLSVHRQLGKRCADRCVVLPSAPFTVHQIMHLRQ